MNNANDTRQIDPVKLMKELNERPEIWLNVIQVMGEVTEDELNDDPTGHANFQTLLAHAMSEHTERFDDEGNETAWLDVYTD